MKNSSALMIIRRLLIATGFLSFPLLAESLSSRDVVDRTRIRCANLIYAGTQSSICFADRFLTRVATETNLKVNKKFTPIKMATKRLFDYPFSVMSGEGQFSLSQGERENLRRYLEGGGFLLASPSCSDKTWDKAFRVELKKLLPDHPLKKINMDHSIFKMVYKIPRLTLKGGGTTLLEGIEINGRIVLIYSKEGVNDVKHAKGCCCCGGDQINECEKLNVNIFTYALLY